MNPREIARLVAQEARRIRKRHPDLEQFVSTGVEDGSRMQVRRSDWPEGVTISVPVTEGSQLAAAGASVLVGYDQGKRNRPFIKRIISLARGVAATVVPAVLLGQWDQTWANYSLNPIADLAFGGAFPSWSGTDAYTYTTDTSTSGVYRAKAILYHPDGHILLIHAQSNSASTGSDAVKIIVRVLGEGSPSFTSLSTQEIVLSDDRDKEYGGYWPDCECFFDVNSKILTVFSRMSDSFPSGDTASDKANVWTLDMTFPFATITPVSSEITVAGPGLDALRKTACCMNVRGNQMARLNLADNYVFFYELDTGTGVWSDVGSPLDWVAALEAIDSSTRSVLGSGTTQIGGGSNFSMPYLTHVSRWIGMAVSDKTDPSPREWSLLELQFLPTGSIEEVVTLWVTEAIARTSLLYITSALEDHAAAVLAANPSYEDDTTTTPVTGAGCVFEGSPEGPYSYDFVEEVNWHGVIGPNSLEFETTLSGGSTTSKFIPYGANQGVAWDASVNAIRPSLPLPAITPNNNVNGDGADNVCYWASTTNSRVVYNLDNGARYCAALIPVGLQVPPSSGETLWETGQETYTQFGNCWFQTYDAIHRGVSGETKFAYELTFFRVDSDNAVTTFTPLPRHTGVLFNGTSATEEVPIPENVYGIINLPHDRIAWLHDDRTGPDANPMPMITVTDETLSSVLFTIPGSELFPEVTIFGTDQTYLGDTWARAGEFDHRLHGTDDSGPLLKAYLSNTNGHLVVGLEFYTRVEPSTGTAGLTTGRQIVIEITDSGYSIINTSDKTQAWTYPTILPVETCGTRTIRSMAIGDDRIVYAAETTSSKKLYQIVG